MPKTITQVAVVALLFSCSGQPEDDTNTLGVGGDRGVAHAAPSSLSSESGMPANLAHISFRFDRLVPNVEVDYLSQNKYPYEVFEEGGRTIVTVFLRQGEKISLEITLLDGNKEPIGDPRTITVDPKAKLGTYDLELGGTDKSLGFGAGVQQELQLGQNTLEGPTDKQFVGEATDSVLHSVFTAQEDQVCNFNFWGCSEMRVIHKGPAICHKGEFSMELKAGDQVGLYPVNPNGPVDIDIAAPSLQPKE